MNPRILAVEDELDWVENFRRWIPEDMGVLEYAETPGKARELLRLRHYDVVLLDLSMVQGEPLNRDNEGIQEYLALGEENTKYIIVSATINKGEVRDAAFRRNAFDIIFKPEIDPPLLRDRIAAALETMEDWRRRFLPNFKKLVLHDVNFESEAVAALHPKGGVKGLWTVMEYLGRSLAPVAVHRSRQESELREGAFLSLVWSRQQGKACSIALSQEGTMGNELRSKLTEWLGFDDREPLLQEKILGGLRVQCYQERSLPEEQFELPVI